MRYLVALLALAGLIVSCFALREHFRTEESPCAINERWDCGVVNHSPFAEIKGVPVAVFGIVGYAAIAAFSMVRRWWIVLLLATAAVAFSVYLTYVEARILETYCIWCVTSAGIISLTEIAAIVAVARRRR
jgi:vitamin-K-epoxide reductase (warfarin-sensitive)